MRRPRQVRRGARQPDAHEARVPSRRRARRRRHHLVGRPVRSSASSHVARTHSLGKRSRSRLIASQPGRRRCRARSSPARRTGRRRRAPRPPRSTAQVGRHDRARARVELVDDLLDRDQRARSAASTASFCTPVMPQSCTLPSRSACWAWTTPTSGRSAGTAVSTSPVNGQVIGLMLAVSGQVGAGVAAQDRERQPGRARDVAVGHARRGCAPRARAGAASRARPRRGSGAASRRPGCRPRRRPACGRSRRRSAGRRRCRASSGPAVRSRRPWRMISCPAANGIRCRRRSACSRRPTASSAAPPGTWTSSTRSTASPRRRGHLTVQFHNAEGDIEFTPAALHIDGKLGVSETIFGDASRTCSRNGTTARRRSSRSRRRAWSTTAAAARRSTRRLPGHGRVLGRPHLGLRRGGARARRARLHLPAARRHQPRLPQRPAQREHDRRPGRRRRRAPARAYIRAHQRGARGQAPRA